MSELKKGEPGGCGAELRLIILLDTVTAEVATCTSATKIFISLILPDVPQVQGRLPGAPAFESCCEY